MLVGVFIRNFKVFKNVNFIPLTKNTEEKFSMLIGDNGVGKSSVLEALDTFFNVTTWNLTLNQKKDDAFIAPVMLIEKIKINSSFDDKMIDYLNKLSSYFWDVDEKTNANLKSSEFLEFFKLRDELKDYYRNDFYLILSGIQYDNKTRSFYITFDKDLEKKLIEEGLEENFINNISRDKLMKEIRRYYKYIYIPVESKVKDVLRLENREMQALMDESILEKIDEILNDKKFKTGRKTESIIDNINSQFNNYIETIGAQISKIDSGYSFKIDGNYKKNLTSSDVRTILLQAYFSIRTLKKDKKEIEELSSGEQRLALIDIATAFLLENQNQNQFSILAIDEPESSLHISKCFSQMERIRNLSINNQVILTTHWYGALPIIDNGFLIYLEKNDKTKAYLHNFKSYFEERGSLPEDIFIKSYFELCASILNSIRADNINWIICEGYDDKLYLDKHLSDKVNNLKVFSVGGCGNVKKLYSYLYLPFLDKNERMEIKSRILFLIDSDVNVQTLEINNASKDKKLRIARLEINSSNTLQLKNLSQGQWIPTEMEDCLNPMYFYNALKKTINMYGSTIEQEAFSLFVFNEKAIVSRIKGENSILKPTIIEFMESKEILYKFMDNNFNKYKLAEQYVSLIDDDYKYPELFDYVIKFFNNSELP